MLPIAISVWLDVDDNVVAAIIVIAAAAAAAVDKLISYVMLLLLLLPCSTIPHTQAPVSPVVLLDAPLHSTRPVVL